MSKGYKLSGAGTSQPQPRTSLSPSGGISSDSQSALLSLTVENVKKLEKEYLTAKGTLSNQSVEEYVKQSTLCLLERERSVEDSREHVSDKKDLEGAISFFPRKLGKKSKETHLAKAEEISHKSSLLAEFQADSLSTPHAGSKSKESKKSVDGSSATHRRRGAVEELGIQTEWSYSDKSLASAENVIREEKRSREDVDGKDRDEPIPSEDAVGLFTDIAEETETQESDEGSEEYNPTKSEDEVVRSESDASGGEDRKSDDEAPWPDSEEVVRDDLKRTSLFLEEENDYDEIQENCEFCKAVTKPIPTVEDLDTQSLETFLCCRTYKEVFECVIRALMESSSFDEEIDIAPHPHLAQTLLESDTKKNLEQCLKERSFDKYRELYERHIKYGPLTTVSFKLLPPQEEVPVVGPAPHESLEELDTEFTAEHLKGANLYIDLTQNYRGRTAEEEARDRQDPSFSISLVSGSLFYNASTSEEQTWLERGNIAILIMHVKEAQFIYVILEDHTYLGIRAIFTNHGYATCYHRNGLIWLNLDRHTGSYFDKKGRRQKHWSWHDFSHHVHAPPFQPICMKLNIYIRIKVVAQDHISLSFMNQQNCIYFNVGTRLKLKDPATLHLLKPAESQLGRLLHSKSIQINSLLAKMKKVLRDLQGTPLNKIQTLPLVMALLRKVLKWRRRKILA